MKGAGGSKASSLVLRLYVAGRAPNSVRAAQNLKRICEQNAIRGYDLEVVDVTSDPARAMSDGVLVTPTLVRLKPEPVQTLLGDLSVESAVLTVLGATGPGHDR
jgi:circadian clock protein KaiB